jgi:hypothetical protein
MISPYKLSATSHRRFQLPIANFSIGNLQSEIGNQPVADGLRLSHQVFALR